MELLAVGLIVHLILVISVGFVAKEKQRDVGAWVFLALFLPVLSLVLVAIVPRKKVTSSALSNPTKLRASEMTKACPECAEEIKLLAKVCRYCGYRFSGDEVAQLRETAERELRTKGIDYCLKCVEFDGQTGKCKKTWFDIAKLRRHNKLSNPCDFKYFKESK